MSDAIVARWRRSQRGLYAAMASLSPGAEQWELGDGVIATAMPVAPDRSLFNAVIADDAQALAAALPVAAERYDALGVLAWTVWTAPGDEASAAACAAAGHVLDGVPEVMGADLAALDLEPLGLDVDVAEPDFGVLAQLNDAAYGIPPEGSFARVLASFPADGPLRCTLLAERGRVVAGAGTLLVDDDCYVLLVAVAPDARGRGLGGEVMRAALRAGREAGAVTTTLEATQLGRPVYARIGYRGAGPAGMWERRRA